MPKTTPNAIAAQTSRTLSKQTLINAAGALLLSLATAASSSATAEEKPGIQGIANYASYLDSDYAKAAATSVEQRLKSQVRINEVEVNGQTWLRLQSQTMDSIQAKSLVVRATAAGFAAWYSSALAAPEQTSEPIEAEPQAIPAKTSAVATAQLPEPTAPANVASAANPRLVAMLPEGPLLGEIYPPRTPVSANATQ